MKDLGLWVKTGEYHEFVVVKKKKQEKRRYVAEWELQKSWTVIRLRRFLHISHIVFLSVSSEKS